MQFNQIRHFNINFLMEEESLVLQSTPYHNYIYSRKDQFPWCNPYFGKGDIELPFQRASLHCDDLVKTSSQW